MSTRILIVEDELALAAAIAYRLAEDGFQPEIRTTGAEALTALRGSPFDLTLLDIGLPDTNGFDLLHTLRGFCNVPNIFLTARAREVDRIAGLELGADDYITKPFSLRELTARVRSVLRRSRREPSGLPDPPSAFSVDAERRRIRYHGHTLPLTRVEYGLLGTLLKRPGRVFSREELLQQVWAHPEARCDRAVDAHIKALRAKLQAVWPGPAVIRTHRGLGYALEEDDTVCAAA
jgi:two-component system catabolic regulation response regulator CreB